MRARRACSSTQHKTAPCAPARARPAKQKQEKQVLLLAAAKQSSASRLTALALRPATASRQGAGHASKSCRLVAVQPAIACAPRRASQAHSKQCAEPTMAVFLPCCHDFCHVRDCLRSALPACACLYPRARDHPRAAALHNQLAEAIMSVLLRHPQLSVALGLAGACSESSARHACACESLAAPDAGPMQSPQPGKERHGPQNCQLRTERYGACSPATRGRPA